MEELFTESQLKNISQESLAQLAKLMQENQAKLATSQKLLDEKVHELEFINEFLSDRLLLAQKKQFGRFGEKYADGFEPPGLFNEAEQEADPDAPEPEMEEVHPARLLHDALSVGCQYERNKLKEYTPLHGCI